MLIDLIQHPVHLFPGLEDVGLLLGVKGVVPVGGRLGRLNHEGTGEGEGKIVPHALFIDKRGGMVEAVLVAQLVELLLVDQDLHGRQVDIG